jgi:hypothetical protein
MRNQKIPIFVKKRDRDRDGEREPIPRPIFLLFKDIEGTK